MSLITETPQDYYEGGNLGSYRYISLQDLVNNFMVAYVGDRKVIDSVRRSDVIYHFKRGIQEMTYDISRSPNIYEIEVTSSLSVAMPQDYVDYDRVVFVDVNGIEHPLLEGDFHSKPNITPLQDSDGAPMFDNDGNLLEGDSYTDTKFKNFDIREFTGVYDETNLNELSDYETSRTFNYGGRYGLEPQYSNKNGFFFIDRAAGKISFSSDVAGKAVNIHYISDGLGTDDVKVHKLEEDALYKYVLHAIVSLRVGVPEYQIRRFRKDMRAAMRNAEIRLQDLNLTQVMKGQTKPIK